tara:strand:+ start:1903 stop:2019 length:117 start_codon:yes stop_codon:yes gene_type:complete
MTCKNVFWNIMEQLKDIKDLAILLHLQRHKNKGAELLG